MLEKYGFKKLYVEGSGPTVVVGMSGGVDSSVAAYILKWQGYKTIGLFMRNWDCDSATDDYDDVKRVAKVIGIPTYSVNFSREYMDNVFEIFLSGLRDGITPNPDVLCNREIKFGVFWDFAKKIGAEFVATGHYARTAGGKLLKGIDPNKDQSYFLCAVKPDQIAKAMFPIGTLEKPIVREIARELNLATAEKPDSTGICFIGEQKIRDFLKTYLGNQPGDIATADGKIIGQHIGLMYYTIGQRKGLGIGGVQGESENRWYVTKKDLKSNTLVVNNGEGDDLFTDHLIATEFNFITQPDSDTLKATCKTRYRQPDQPVSATIHPDRVEIKFDTPQRAITPGQWAVLYDGDVCLGGGVIKTTW